MKFMHRVNTVRVAVALALVAYAHLPSVAVAAEVSATAEFDIPTQELPAALLKFAAQSGVQVTSPSDLLEGRSSGSVVGTYSAREALEHLLANTSLNFKFLDSHTVAIRDSKPSSISQRSAEASTPGSTSSRDVAEENANARADGRQSMWRRLSQASGASQVANQSSAADSTASGILAEVIVTAQKRAERLQDVPVPVTVINTEVLTQTNQVLLQDYYLKVPGLAFTMGGDGSTPQLSIRGITGGSGAPAVGVVIDDIPFGSSTGLNTRGQPDIDPGELARIEVLRGPQGTLYGANSMGGLLKFVTIDPSTDGVSGRIQAGASTLFNGEKPGYNVRGSVNVPISSATAMRVSAFTEQDGGYIKETQTGKTDANSRTSEGGRVSFLLKPTEDFSLKLGALIQDSKRDGANAASIGPSGELQQRYLPNSIYVDLKSQAYSAIANAEFGDLRLTSLTGYSIDRDIAKHDLNGVAGGFWQNSGAIPYANLPYALLQEAGEAKRFSEELRLTAPLGDRIDLLLGGYYANEINRFDFGTFGADATGRTNNTIDFYAQHLQTKYKEYSAFTNLTYSLSDRFNIQAGVRVSRDKQNASISRAGGLATAIGAAENLTDLLSKETPVTYQLTPQYKISPDLMVYARFATGYRIGGANQACGVQGVVCQFGPEKTRNYEAGLKGSFFDHLLSLDASVYYIDWTDIQSSASTSDGLFNYTVNRGTAKSQGIELSAELEPIQGLTLSGWIAYDDAVYTSNIRGAVYTTNPAGALSGDRLPLSARYSGALSVDERFQLNSDLTAFVGGTASYVGDRIALYGQYLPGYTQIDLNGGVKRGTWTLTAYLRNVADTRGKLDGGLAYQYLYQNPNSYSFIQPRTFGLNLVKTF